MAGLSCRIARAADLYSVRLMLVFPLIFLSGIKRPLLCRLFTLIFLMNVSFTHDATSREDDEPVSNNFPS